MSKKTLDCILLPVDGSEGSLRAAEFAGQLASSLGIQLQLIYAFPKDAGDTFGLHFLNDGENKVDFMDPDAFAELSKKKSKVIFEQVRKQLHSYSDLQIKEVLLSGDPAGTLLEYAEKQSSPMLVVGRRGLSTFAGLVMGSVSQKLVQHAPCPVTVVH